MTNDLVKRLRVREWGCPSCRSDKLEAADRIEQLKEQLSLMANTLEVTQTEPQTQSWVRFCDEMIAASRKMIGGNE